LESLSKSAASAADSKRASAYSVQATSHSKACLYAEPTMMTPLGRASLA
jgi:hypothetical protein